MGLPEKLPIERIEDYHTHYLGSCSDGRLFWGYITFFYPKGTLGTQDWQKHRRDYVVLHTFDNEGSHLNTRSWFVGSTANLNHRNVLPGMPVLPSEHGRQDTFEKLEEWIVELGEVKYHDIEVKLFQVIIDEVAFGLVPDLEDEEDISVELMPSSTISFYEPWDGEYYT